LRLYLTGFQESRIRPESQKITQKVAGKKYDDSPFTLFILTIVMVANCTPPACNRKFTNGRHLSALSGMPKVKQILTVKTWRLVRGS